MHRYICRVLIPQVLNLDHACTAIILPHNILIKTILLNSHDALSVATIGSMPIFSLVTLNILDLGASALQLTLQQQTSNGGMDIPMLPTGHLRFVTKTEKTYAILST